MASIVRWRRRVNELVLKDSLGCRCLEGAMIDRRCREGGHRWRSSFWSPATTVLAFLLQVLSAEKTLRMAVAAILVQLKARDVPDLPSADPAAYCQARRRLPDWLCDRLCGDLVRSLEAEMGQDCRWRGHRVRVVDGTSAEPNVERTGNRIEKHRP